MSRTLRAWIAAGALALSLSAPASVSAQCAMCKTALTNSEEGRGMSAEFNRAILLMLAAPYLMMGAFATYLLRGHIRVLVLRTAARVRPAARSVFLRG